MGYKIYMKVKVHSRITKCEREYNELQGCNIVWELVQDRVVPLECNASHIRNFKF